MARHLYGYLDELASEEATLYEAGGNRIELSKVSPRDKVILFVAGAEVSILGAILPVRSENEARRAAPFAIEDEIAASVEDVHIALGSAASDLQTPRVLHVASLERMKSWLTLLSAKPELRSAQLVAEHSVLLPGQAFESDGNVIANVEGRAFCLESAMPSDLRRALLGGVAPVSVSKAERMEALMDNTMAMEDLVNLRQGPFRSRGGGHLPSLKQWRLSGGLAAALGLVWGIHSMFDIYSMRTQHEKIHASIAAAYERALPNEPRPTNYVRAVSRAVNEQTGVGAITFRDASAALYKVLADMSGAQLLSLRYDREDSALVATIAYAAYGDDTILKNALVETGLSVNLGDARQERAGVVGDVTLRRGTL